MKGGMYYHTAYAYRAPLFPMGDKNKKKMMWAGCADVWARARNNQVWGQTERNRLTDLRVWQATSDPKSTRRLIFELVQQRECVGTEELASENTPHRFGNDASPALTYVAIVF